MSWIHDDEQIKDWEKSIQFKLVHKRRKDKIHNIRKALNLSKKENNEPPVCRICIRKFNTPYELSHHLKCNHPNYKKVEEPPVTTSSLLDTFGSKREAASSYYSEAATSNFSLSVPEPRFQISGPDISDAETHDNSSENPPILEPTASNLEPLGQRRRNESKDGSHTSELNENEHYPHPAPRHSFREPSSRYSSRVSSYHSSSNDQYHNVHIKISPADPYSVGSPDDKEIVMDEINYGGTSTEEDDPEPEELYTKNEKVEPIHINTITTGKKAYLDLPKIKIPTQEEYENIIIEERLEIPDVARLRASIPHGEDFSDEFTCNLDSMIQNDYLKAEVERELAIGRSRTSPKPYQVRRGSTLEEVWAGCTPRDFEETEKTKTATTSAAVATRSIRPHANEYDEPNKDRRPFANSGLLYEKPKDDKPFPVEKSCWPQSVGRYEGLYHIFDKSDTWAGQVIAVIIMAFIFVSGIAMCLETLPENRFPNYGTTEDDTAPIFRTIDVICVAVFTVEYLIRLGSAGYVRWVVLEAYKPPKGSSSWCGEIANKRFAFFWKPLNFIDFLAIIPFYLEMLTDTSGLGGSFTVLRLLRILRILRLFKLAKYVKTLRLYGMVAKEVAKPMFLLLFFVLLCCLLGATFMYIAEKGKYDDIDGYYRRYNIRLEKYEKTPFESIPLSMWWAIATYTTVGYGEVVPATTMGYLIGGFYIILGVIAFSMPISLMSTAYTEVTDKMMHEPNVYNKIQTSTNIVAKLRYAVAYLDELEGYLKRLKKKQIDRMERAIERKKKLLNSKNNREREGHEQHEEYLDDEDPIMLMLEQDRRNRLNIWEKYENNKNTNETTSSEIVTQ